MHSYTATEILAAIVVLIAAATDLRARRIPNWLTLSGLCAGLLTNGVLYGLKGIGTSLSGLAAGLGVYLIFYLLRAMGAGDVKLMAAIGAIVGPEHWFVIFIASSIAGGVFAVVLMIWKGRAKEILLNAVFIATELAHFRAPYQRRGDLDVKNPAALRMPHGLAIAAGTMTCLGLALV
jgi:prepilin peptidase CpaA